MLGLQSVIIAQEQDPRRQFYDVVELTKLIEKAREAGFSDEQIARLELRDGGRTVNVQAYMESLRQKKSMRDEKLQNFLNKKFLTVQDIFKELLILEPSVLIRLREELVSER
ncbi:MAG: hypothetical protein COB67_03660 [SAR324 cluster bacterium]|uniref:Uncharacterized protein n=1 Tax=SAR324 cluster bacterium TaxID=2024889 RepID=A0A2A4T7U6_9DELT|nr:MAG: hypothetical protein COB67_03660 [SAR324 cluster bacterium]